MRPKKPTEFVVDKHSFTAIRDRARAAIDVISRPLRSELAPYFDWAWDPEEHTALHNDLNHPYHKVILSLATRDEAQTIYTAIRCSDTKFVLKKIYALREAGLVLDWNICRAVVDGLIGQERIYSNRYRRYDINTRFEPHVHKAWIKQMRDMGHSRPVERVLTVLAEVSPLPKELVELVGDFIEIKHNRRKAVYAMRDEPPAKRPRKK